MKRKTLIIVLAVICAFCVIFAACKKHEHEFSKKWSFNATHHWHDATCDDTDEVTDKREHNFENNRCLVCGYEKGGFSWKTATSSSSGSTELVMPTNYPKQASEPSLMIHYYRTNSSDYKKWGYWLWNKTADRDGTLYNIAYQEVVDGQNASITIVPLSTLGVTTSQTVGLIPRLQSDWTKDGDADRLINLSAYTMDSNNYIHVYLVEGNGSLFKTKADFDNGVLALQYGLNAEFTSTKRIEISTASPIKSVEIYVGGEFLDKTETTDTMSVAYNFAENSSIDFGKTYTVKAVFSSDDAERNCTVDIRPLYSSAAFDEAFYFDGELGALYTQNSTEFRVWSPVSSRIVLNLYSDGTGGTAYATHEMTKGDQGVFSVTVSGDLAQKYYTYTVYNSVYDGAEIVDPYAKSAGLNGERGQIVNFSETNPTGWDSVSPKQYDANELTVWETHVADVTSSDTWNGPEELSKTFLGMIQPNTKYTKNGTTVSTGFDHIVELGVNAVQLVPIFDQANNEANPSFNWGYNPLNYNVLEGSYSTNAADGYARIREFKQLVQAFNGKNINIIMDVVYNHVNAAAGSNFDVLMPGYFYRYTSTGAFSNGSGCGNETASERSMYRKFMIDSVCFWAQEYKLGGFRFDLMGLHDLETMNQLTAALKKINPAIVVYGEPWTGGTTTLTSSQQATQANGSKYVGYGQFNDQMRDALIKGGMSAATEKGWATGGSGDATNLTNGLKGFTGSKILDLYKTVNYVTCHDNYTLKDRIRATGQSNEDTIKKMAMLANSVVFSSNGVTFMLAGEEFLRSKQDNGAVGEQIHNSYNASYEVNALNYELKVDNYDMFQNYQKLIALKQMFVKDFGLNSNDAVTAKYKVANNGNSITITITAKDGTSWKIVHANGLASGVTENFAGYNTLYLNTLGGSSWTPSATTSVAPYQTIIAHT